MDKCIIIHLNITENSSITTTKKALKNAIGHHITPTDYYID